jgi:hypothetical protein
MGRIVKKPTTLDPKAPMLLRGYSFSDMEYQEYCRNLHALYEKSVAPIFPILKLECDFYHRLPGTIRGYAIDANTLAVLEPPPADYWRYGPLIYAVVPKDFIHVRMSIYDAYHNINYGAFRKPGLPDFHFYSAEKGMTFRSYCTGRGNYGLTPENILVQPIRSVLRLYQAWLGEDQKKPFTLECEPHGTTTYIGETNYHGKR